MREKMNLFLLVFLLFFVSSCRLSSQNEQRIRENAWFDAHEGLRVLTTTAMIRDLVSYIGGDTVHVIELVQGDIDPHSYQLVKGDDEKLALADIIFYNGLGLEHGGSTLGYLLHSSKAIPLGNLVFGAHPEKRIVVDRVTDPHIWMDISLWVETIPFIVEVLAKYDGAHAEEYKERGEKLQEELLTKHADIRQKLQSLPPNKRYLVTSHDAFNYFTRAYLAEESEIATGEWEKRFAAPEGLAPESQLSAHDIQEMITYLKMHDVHVLFPESNISKDSIRKIVSAGKEFGLDLIIAESPLYGDAMGSPGSTGDSYRKMIEHNAETIYYYLSRS